MGLSYTAGNGKQAFIRGKLPRWRGSPSGFSALFCAHALLKMLADLHQLAVGRNFAFGIPDKRPHFGRQGIEIPFFVCISCCISCCIVSENTIFLLIFIIFLPNYLCYISKEKSRNHGILPRLRGFLVGRGDRTRTCRKAFYKWIYKCLCCILCCILF